jgi:hypothetical protein
MRDIKELIDDARATNCDVHDYVALHLYGHVTPETRNDAKNLAFPWLYGGNGKGKVYKESEAPTMIRSEAAKKVFAHTYAPPNVQSTNFAIQFSGARKRMLDTFAQHTTPKIYKQYTVKVKGDEDYNARCYSVPALSAQSARVLAFTLHGGFGTFDEADPVLQDDEIELALTWTEVID